MGKPVVDNDLLQDYCANAFRTAIKMRKTTLQILSDNTGIPYRTLQGYSSGRVSLRNASAAVVLDIADELNINPYVLIGELKLDTFIEEVSQEKYQETKKRFESKKWLPSNINKLE